jgi:hypothetical protein
MRARRARFKFGVKLTSQKPRVVFDLDNLHKAAIR